MRKLWILPVLVLAALCAAATISTAAKQPASHMSVCGPVSPSWITAVTDGKTATTNPYRPASATGTSSIDVTGFTGLVVRAKYPRAQTLTTDPIVYVWGLKNDTWCALYDSTGRQSITLSDNATTDCDDGTTYKWTLPSDKIDALGCHQVIVTVATAGVASSGGSIPIELTPF